MKQRQEVTLRFPPCIPYETHPPMDALAVLQGIVGNGDEYRLEILIHRDLLRIAAADAAALNGPQAIGVRVPKDALRRFLTDEPAVAEEGVTA